MKPKKTKRKVRTGVVLSDKMDKSIVVRVERTVRHPIYRRVIRQATKFKVHDEGNTAKVGNKVQIIETRPISKEKRWRLVKVL